VEQLYLPRIPHLLDFPFGPTALVPVHALDRDNEACADRPVVADVGSQRQ